MSRPGNSGEGSESATARIAHPGNDNGRDDEEQSQQSSYRTNHGNDDLEDVPEDKEPYINEVIDIWEEGKLRDSLLWQEFRMEFGKWQHDDFAALRKLYKSKLRNFLRLRGVYVNTKRTIPQGLVDILEEEVRTTWPEQELLESINTHGTEFNSHLNFHREDSTYVLEKKLKEREAAISQALQTPEPQQQTVTPGYTPMMRGAVRPSIEQTRPVQSTAGRQNANVLPHQSPLAPREQLAIPRHTEFGRSPERFQPIRENRESIREEYSPVRGVRFDKSPVRDIDGINDNGAQRGLA